MIGAACSRFDIRPNRHLSWFPSGGYDEPGKEAKDRAGPIPKIRHARFGRSVCRGQHSRIWHRAASTRQVPARTGLGHQSRIKFGFSALTSAHRICFKAPHSGGGPDGCTAVDISDLIVVGAPNPTEKARSALQRSRSSGNRALQENLAWLVHERGIEPHIPCSTNPSAATPSAATAPSAGPTSPTTTNAISTPVQAARS